MKIQPYSKILHNVKREWVSSLGTDMEQPTETLINETAKCRESVYGDMTYEKKEKPPTCICLCTQTTYAEQRQETGARGDLWGGIVWGREGKGRHQSCESFEFWTMWSTNYSKANQNKINDASRTPSTRVKSPSPKSGGFDDEDVGGDNELRRGLSRVNSWQKGGLKSIPSPSFREKEPWGQTDLGSTLPLPLINRVNLNKPLNTVPFVSIK